MKNTIKIFSETGCISHAVLWKYRMGTLSPKEKHEVELHLTDCELCSDALAGMAMMNSDKIISELQMEVGNITAQKKVIRFYDYRLLLAAASIALLLVFIYVIEPFKDSDKKEIAQLIKHEEKKTEETITSSVTAPDKEITLNAKEENVQEIKSNSQESTGMSRNVATKEPENVTIPAVQYNQNETALKNAAVASSDEIKSSGNSINAKSSSDEMKDEENKPTVASKINAESEKNESSKIAYKKSLHAERTPAMTSTKSHDSANTTAPAPVENNVASEANLPAIELPFVYSATLNKGLSYYRNNQTVEALESFNEILHYLPDDLKATFYKGLCYFEAGNYFPSIDLLQKTIDNQDKQFYEQAKFKLALSYAGLKQTIKAKKIFQEIISEKSFYSDKAKEEMNKIK
ncbi:MAG: tetratricopeptide repeat protein [Bacteroidia bacterium]|nr:tetratricopeptide repeat protein [Bacteroidia bacterium]